MERNGGVAAIVCDTTENTVRQGSCDRCLAIGGGYGNSVGSLSKDHLLGLETAGYSALFFQDFMPPKKAHAQNSRPELLALLSDFAFLNPLFTPCHFP